LASLMEFVSPKLVVENRLDEGTDEGRVMKDPKMQGEYILWSPVQRLKRQFMKINTVYRFGDDNRYGIQVEAGAEFLRWNIVFIDRTTSTTLTALQFEDPSLKDCVMMPFREPIRLIAKMIRTCERDLSPVQMLLKWTQFAYLAVGNFNLYSDIKLVYENYMDRMNLTPTSMMAYLNSLTIKEVNKRMRFKAGLFTREDLMAFPTYQQVLNFYSIENDQGSNFVNFKMVTRKNHGDVSASNYMVNKNAIVPVIETKLRDSFNEQWENLKKNMIKLPGGGMTFDLTKVGELSAIARKYYK